VRVAQDLGPGSGTVSTKNPTDITVGAFPKGVAVTSDSKTAFVTNANFGNVQEGPIGDSVSTFDVKTRTKNPTDIPVGENPIAVAITPDGKTAFSGSGSGFCAINLPSDFRARSCTDNERGRWGSAT
jgi:DNA-binding beta-propeller fold protein YncE